MSSRYRAAALRSLGAAGLLIMGALFWTLTLCDASVAEPAAHTLRLEYSETSEALVSREVPSELASVPFRKEPLLKGKEVIRGLLRWGTASEPPVRFLWDKTEHTLRLDLNGNQDLEDDANGAFNGSTNSYGQLFTNVPLTRVTAAGTYPVRVRLEFRQYGSRLVVSAGLCSYWQAKATLDGREWQFGILENVLDRRPAVSPQYLLWRPWAERDNPFHLLTSSADFADYATNLFLAGQAWTLDCHYDSAGAAPFYRATLTARPANMGELKLTGSSVHRLFLKEETGLLALLDKPEGTVPIPAGKYRVEEIWLRSQGIEVARFRAGTVKVPVRGRAQLKAGAPLTNAVTVQSRGHSLSLTYKLLGLDGTEYHFPRRPNERPPEFAIFDRTNRLAAGKFAYG